MKLLLLFGAVAAALFYKKGVQASKLDTQIKSVQAKKSGTNISVRIGIDVYNPNQSNLKFDRFIGNVLLDNLTRVADIDLKQPALFKARETTTMYIPVVIPISRLTANILDALNKLLGKSPLKLTLKGVLYAENLKVPIKQDFVLNLNV